MKLGKYAAALVVTSFLLTGCGNSKTVKEDGKYVVVSLSKDKKDKNIFADDIFEDITNTTSGKSAFFEAVLQQLMDDKFPIDDDMETDAKRTVDQIQAYYESQYGDSAEEQLNTILSSSGYASLDAYREAMVKAYQKSNFLLDYVENNFDEVFDDYYTQSSPREASIIKVAMTDVDNPTEAESTKLNEVAALISSSKSFGDIAKDYSDDTATKMNKGSLGVIDKTSSISSTYGSDVETKILALNEGETSEAIKGSDGYYFVTVTNTDKDTIKKSLKKDLSIDSPLISYDLYLPYIAYQSYDVKYSDDDVEKLVNSIIEEALKERETSRGGTE